MIIAKRRKFAQRTRIASIACVGITLLIGMASYPSSCRSQAPQRPSEPVPVNFPRFLVPGHQKEMDGLRSLFWLHYPAAARAASPTLWDEWLSAPSLWPALVAGDSADGRTSRERWRQALSTRIVDREGYVATHQHISMAHPLGWPLPPGYWGSRGCQWHFSFQNAIPSPYRYDKLSTPEGWTLSGALSADVKADGWHIALSSPNAVLTAPAKDMDAAQAPFLLLNWRGVGIGTLRPYIEWTTREHPQWSARRRVDFEPPTLGEKRVYHRGTKVLWDAVEANDIVYQPIAVFRHPQWRGDITRLRIGFGNREAKGHAVVQALVSSFDTRHNANNQAFIAGCASYFGWSGDIAFLRDNMPRMRTALRYLQHEFEIPQHGYAWTKWPGHDGRSGIARQADGTIQPLPGRGIGSNYWDLLPFGGKDTYATILYFGALRHIIDLERLILAHPEWKVLGSGPRFNPKQLEEHAAHVKSVSNRVFWNTATQRFAANIDSDGQAHDYGFTWLNLEAIHYDFATPEHAAQIMAWLDGRRVVAGDTAQGHDIYHWRFGPRATTKRNLDYYTFWWNKPEQTPWGHQVQDGGAVLGFSYHDLMARLKILGPDNAWTRLRQIAMWFEDVQNAGGYRAYYKTNPGGATLQGGGTAGGLGVDNEFKESVLLPQVLLDGFMGFVPRGDGFALEPRLPREWPEFTIDRISWHDQILRVRATHNSLEIGRQTSSGASPTVSNVAIPVATPNVICWIKLPQGFKRVDGAPLARRSDGAFGVRWSQTQSVRFEKSNR
ncbi:MAG: hypothetical protein JWN98_650 [Abditibacteriota bacterium]|nr:hypothetical protein [Abditibacteriota bacterium]